MSSIQYVEYRVHALLLGPDQRGPKILCECLPSIGGWQSRKDTIHTDGMVRTHNTNGPTTQPDHLYIVHLHNMPNF